MALTRRAPRLGLALGSGSARGWAHIGVLQVLQEEGIRPDVVCGSSIGALVGAAYAAGGLEEGASVTTARAATTEAVIRWARRYGRIGVSLVVA